MALVVTDDRTVGWVELSGENLSLAAAELSGAVEALGGRIPLRGGAIRPGPTFVEVELASAGLLGDLGGRLALARRVLAPISERAPDDLERRLAREGASGHSAAFRPLARGRGSLATPWALRLADAYRASGGSIDLKEPVRRFWIHDRGDGVPSVFEEVGSIDRGEFERRRLPRLPYQRPVTLAPRLGRVVANLGAVRRGDPVADPFAGTGALLLEAALLGARVSGLDQSAEMVRGALRNLSRFDVQPERLDVADASSVFSPSDGGGWAAILTDPPYGRASGSRGEPPADLLRRVLPIWADRVRPGGRVVVVVPGGPDPLPPPWIRTQSVPDRVHRSLTREFRVYQRKEETAIAQ